MISKIYKRLAVQLKKYPSVKDMQRIGVSERQIYNEFGNMAELRKIVKVKGIKPIAADLEAIYKALGVKNV